MSCRLPGGIEGLTALSDSTRAGHVAVGKVPFSRWDMDAVTLQSNPDIPRDIKTRMSFGGFVDDLELFDANFFRISPAEVSAMDPQHRLLLEYTYLALDIFPPIYFPGEIRKCGNKG